MLRPIARKIVLEVLSPACAKLPQPSSNQGIQKWPPAQRRVQFYPRVYATAASTSSSPFSPPRWYLRASRAPFFSTPSSRSSSPLPLGRSRCRIFRLDRYPLDPVRSRLHQADSHSQETRLRQPCGRHAHGLSWLRNVAQRSFTPPGGPPPATFFAFQLLGLLVFVAFISVGFLFRHRPETHKRLMISGTVLILTPAVARIFFLFTTSLVIFKALGVQLAILLACIAYDYATRKPVHPAYLTAVVTLVSLLPVAGLVGSTPLWQAFAHRVSGI